MVGRKKGKWWDRLGQTGRQVAFEAIAHYTSSQARDSSGQTKRDRNSSCPMRNVFVWCVLELRGIHVSQGDAAAFVRYFSRTDSRLDVSSSSASDIASHSLGLGALPFDPAVVSDSQLKVSVDILEDGHSLQMIRFKAEPLVQLAPFLFDVRLDGRYSRDARIIYDTVWSLVPNSDLKVDPTSTGRPDVILTTLTRNEDKYTRGHYFDIPFKEIRDSVDPTVNFFRVEHRISLSGNAILLNNLLSTAFGPFPLITGIRVTYRWVRAVSAYPDPPPAILEDAVLSNKSAAIPEDILPQTDQWDGQTVSDPTCAMPLQLQSPFEKSSPYDDTYVVDRPASTQRCVYSGQNTVSTTMDGSSWYTSGAAAHAPRFYVPFYKGLSLPFVPAEDGGLIGALCT